MGIVLQLTPDQAAKDAINRAMDKRLQLADMRQRHAEQIAWGAKGTSLGNQIAALEDELRPVWLRHARKLGFWAFAGACLFIFWVSFGAGIWGFLSPLIHAMMD